MIRFMIGVGLLLVWMTGAAVPAVAGDAKVSTVEALYAKKDQLNGKRIQISGKVVKVNNGIMGKNFFHLQDGSGKAPANDLTVTTQEIVKVGDQVTVTGLVTVNRDFGAGYSYPLILEEATVTAPGH
jgi:RecJ-like exonuclease